MISPFSPSPLLATFFLTSLSHFSLLHCLSIYPISSFIAASLSSPFIAPISSSLFSLSQLSSLFPLTLSCAHWRKFPPPLQISAPPLFVVLLALISLFFFSIFSLLLSYSPSHARSGESFLRAQGNSLHPSSSLSSLTRARELFSDALASLSTSYFSHFLFAALLFHARSSYSPVHLLLFLTSSLSTAISPSSFSLSLLSLFPLSPYLSHREINFSAYLSRGERIFFTTLLSPLLHTYSLS